MNLAFPSTSYGSPAVFQIENPRTKHLQCKDCKRQLWKPACTQDVLGLSHVSQLISIKRRDIGQDIEIILCKQHHEIFNFCLPKRYELKGSKFYRNVTIGTEAASSTTALQCHPWCVLQPQCYKPPDCPAHRQWYYQLNAVLSQQ